MSIYRITLNIVFIIRNISWLFILIKSVDNETLYIAKTICFILLHIDPYNIFFH